MSNKINTKTAKSISNYFKIIEKFISESTDDDCTFYFRGESEDYQENALTPSIYRDGLINSEEKIYREVSRYNNIDFSEDVTTFDKLCRMQHYSAPTRLIDLSDDPLTALWFAINEGKKQGVVYLIKIKKSKIKYSDSDTVTVISNLAKIEYSNKKSEKSKQKIANDVKFILDSNESIDEFNSLQSIKFLLHEIRNDVNHFEPIIDPRHISSIQCVKPKLTNSRIKIQKGAFLLFGLNIDEPQKHFSLFRKQEEADNEYELNKSSFHDHPVDGILKIYVGGIDNTILSKIGLTEPSIYPEMDKVSEYFKNIYKKSNL
jgi:hypothetical protein